MGMGMDRVSLLERRVDELEQSLRRMQRLAATPSGEPAAAPSVVVPRKTRIESPAPRPAPRPGWEDVLGGRVLGWAGAVAVLLGVVFLVAVAIGRGWIDEPARIALAFAVSLALLAVGAW